MLKIILPFFLVLSASLFAQPAEIPATDQPAAGAGRDSRWRHLLTLGAGSLSMHGDGPVNTLAMDYEKGRGVAIGIIENYRPNEHWGLEFGTKLMSFSRKAKGLDLDLSLTYLALPLEFRYKFLTLFQRSGIFVKGGLTYLILLTASVNDTTSESEGDSDWDWDDAYPSPPTEGSYRGSFNKTDVLASLGFGADFLLFQVRDSFNMSLIPELIYYKGLTTISKSGEFGGKVYNEGYLVNLSVAFGF